MYRMSLLLDLWIAEHLGQFTPAQRTVLVEGHIRGGPYVREYARANSRRAVAGPMLPIFLLGEGGAVLGGTSNEERESGGR
jgi:hypothetical protein